MIFSDNKPKQNQNANSLDKQSGN